MFTCARILFLVSLLFVALLDPFDPYSPFKFLINLVVNGGRKMEQKPSSVANDQRFTVIMLYR